MSAKSKSKQQEALQFLDAFDSITPPPNVEGNKTTNPAAPEGEAAEVLAFLDEITQKSSEPTHTRSATPANVSLSRAGTPAPKKSTERVRLGGGSASLSSTSLQKISNGSKNTDGKASSADQTADEPSSKEIAGGWGWGSVWSTASAAIKQAKSAVDEQVKAIPHNEQARKWSEGVMEYARNTQLDKLSQDFKRVGLSTLNDILNVVAPPISEHEVIRVWLSHDMQGYDGIESLTYKSLARILEQVEGGDLVVNRGNESRLKEGASQERDLNAVHSYEAALKLTEANVEEMVKPTKETKSKSSAMTVPTTYSDAYIRVQPFFTEYRTSSDETANQNLQFLIYLADPEHQLVHSTLTQSIPIRWLDMWNEYEWVEDFVAEALRIGVEVIGQEYIISRMGWAGHNKNDGEQESSEGNTP